MDSVLTGITLPGNYSAVSLRGHYDGFRYFLWLMCVPRGCTAAWRRRIGRGGAEELVLSGCFRMQNGAGAACHRAGAVFDLDEQRRCRLCSAARVLHHSHSLLDVRRCSSFSGIR
jgi:hypothetical protein